MPGLPEIGLNFVKRLVTSPIWKQASSPPAGNRNPTDSLLTLGALCSSFKEPMVPNGMFYVQLDPCLEDFIHKQPEKESLFINAIASATADAFRLAFHPVKHMGTCSVGNDFVVFIQSSGPNDVISSYTEVIKQQIRTRLTSINDAPPFVISRPVRVFYAELDPSAKDLESTVHITIKELHLSEVNSQMRDNELQALLGNILLTGSITCLYQPIVSLRTGTVFGYEALTRGPNSTPLENPVVLFGKAHEFGCLFELEVLAKEIAVKNAAPFLQDHYLFLNVSPLVINDHNHRQGRTKRILEEYGLNIERVVLELTEKDLVPNSETFQEVLKYYRKQGFLVAIDDVGAGYSNLKAIADLQPDFIKLDMSLVRDVDKKYTQKVLLETLCSLASKTGSRIVAEGIETPGELEVLFDIGCSYGQGYLFAKPGHIDSPVNLEPYKKLRAKKFANSSWQHKISVRHIGSIATQDFVVSPKTKVEEVIQLFENNRLTNGVVVCEDGFPVGLVMRHRLNSILATRFGYDLFVGREVANIMKQHFLSVPWDTPLEQVAFRLTETTKSPLGHCGSGSIDDYVVVTKDGKYFGVVSVLKLVDALTKSQIEEARDANPLTGLPGNRVITERIASDLSQKKPIAVLYLDLDNFKSFNDCYGFERGDSVISLTAHVITSVVAEYGNAEDFVGHIGGDDFVVVTSPDKAVPICEKVIQYFDENIVSLYEKNDVDRGYIVTVNRKGEITQVPIMTISIAMVVNNDGRFSNYLELAAAAAEIKNFVKSRSGSCYMVDRRKSR